MRIFRPLLFFIKRCSILEHVNVINCFGSLLLITLICILFLPATYSQNDTGVIQGELIDGKLGEPIANHPVTLNIHRGEEISQQETTTDEDGHYHFENLSIDMQNHYSVTTTYDGTVHEEKDLVLSSFVPNLVVDINIGGITDDPSKISIKTYSLAIGFASEDDIKKGILSIFEVFVVKNNGTLPFQTKYNGEDVGLYFALPQGHENFKPFAPASLTISSSDDHAILPNPIPPGEMEGGFGYSIQSKGRDIQLSRPMSFHTEQITFLVPEGISIVPRSKRFVMSGRTQFHGTVYIKYAAATEDGFPIGETPDMSLVLTKQQIGSDETKESNIGQMVLIAVAAALAGGFLVAAIFTLRGTQRSTDNTDTTDATHKDMGWLRKLNDTDLENTRNTRLELITMLDVMHEKEDISDRVYNRLRKEQTDRLSEILDQRKERGIDS